MSRILITGVSGFLGSHVAVNLCKAGHSLSGTFHVHPERFDLVLGGTGDKPAPLLHLAGPALPADRDQSR